MANVFALFCTAVLLRVCYLDNIPGINGDEAWSGVQALKVLNGETITWRTPSGNPINWFFFAPVLAIHAILPPSFWVLRLTAVVSGLLALAANYVLCRRAFDARTAMVSTLLLALMPTNIGYSRFAWDASESLLATVFVLYLPLIHFRRWPDSARQPLGAMLALAAAILVHPTNIFAAPLVVVPIVRRRWQLISEAMRSRLLASSWRLLAGAFVVSVAAALLAWPWLARGNRVHGPGEIGAFAARYLELFSGTTLYAFISGADQYAKEAPWSRAVTALGNLAFGSVTIVALLGVLQRLNRRSATMDASVVVGWSTMLIMFFVIAGPAAITANLERYGMCLLAPGALVVARGLTWWMEGQSSRQKAFATGLAIIAWLWPVSFYLNYFEFIERTGGRSHLTFHTAAIEPKRAALGIVLGEADRATPCRVVCHDWWNYWPIAYLARGQRDVQVLTGTEWQTLSAEKSRRFAHTWFVDFSGSPAQARIRAECDAAGLSMREETICDYAGHVLITVIHPVGKLLQNY